MRTGIVVEVTAAERDRLEAIVADRNSPQKHVWRAGIVLATADGLGTVAIMRHTAKSKTVVWRWQERFSSSGCHGRLPYFMGRISFNPGAQRVGLARARAPVRAAFGRPIDLASSDLKSAVSSALAFVVLGLIGLPSTLASVHPLRWGRFF
jgi:hypothetical protein